MKLVEEQYKHFNMNLGLSEGILKVRDVRVDVKAQGSTLRERVFQLLTKREKMKGEVKFLEERKR